MPNQKVDVSVNVLQSLALLYVQHQDLSDKAPKEIYAMYNSAFEEIKSASREARHGQLNGEG